MKTDERRSIEWIQTESDGCRTEYLYIGAGNAEHFIREYPEITTKFLFFSA